MKIYIWALIVIVALGGTYYFSKNKKLATEKVDESSVCFAYTSEGNGIKDVYSLALNIKGDKATGELKFLPQEKDSKVGTFEGLISPLASDSSQRVIAAWWDTMGEGMEVREQLAILLDGKTAAIGFGEMKLGDDGSYVYADPNNVSYPLTLAGVDCVTGK